VSILYDGVHTWTLNCIFTHVFLFRYGAGQLKIMYVGGPNTRKDFHIEEGEEVSKLSHVPRVLSLTGIGHMIC
jgi:hypothetical protein